jgi:hypothetical protein
LQSWQLEDAPHHTTSLCCPRLPVDSTPQGLLFKDIKSTNITWDTEKNIITHIDLATADKAGSKVLGGTYGFMPPEAFQKVLLHNWEWVYAKDEPGLATLSTFHRASWDMFCVGVVMIRCVGRGVAAGSAASCCGRDKLPCTGPFAL